MRRRGHSLAELLVALVLIAFGGSLSTRLLVQATREMEGAELALRAALHVLRVERVGGWEGGIGAGPGVLRILRWNTEEPESRGGRVVQYVPPPVRGGEGEGGYFQSWRWEVVPR